MKGRLIEKGVLMEMVEARQPKLPSHLARQLSKGRTSLGNHPCFPPEDEHRFDYRLCLRRYKGVLESVGRLGDCDIENTAKLSSLLSSIVSECQKLEKPVRADLEKLAVEVTTRLFQIPDEFIDFKCEIVDSVDNSAKPLTPESSEDREFESIERLEELSDEVYKRRFVNAMIQGASSKLSSRISEYVREIYDINPRLPELYDRIITLNSYLLFKKADADSSPNDAGGVDVHLKGDDEMVSIESKGIIFPVLLNETIKGVLELFASHGLPEDMNEAQYVVGKSDFQLAELWDERLGYPIWESFEDSFSIAIDSFGYATVVSEVFALPTHEFTSLMREVLGKTRKGKQMVSEFTQDLEYRLGKEEFESHMSMMGDEYGDDDDGFFTADELIC